LIFDRRARVSGRGPSLRRSQALWRSCVLLPLAAAGCSSSSSTLAYTPYTGVDVLSSGVTAGVGCGEQGEQVFRYVVLLSDPNPSDAGSPSLAPLPDGAPPVWASVFSCFTNGAFASITTSPSGGPLVEAWVYAYDLADFQAAQATVPAFACPDPTCLLTLDDVRAMLQTRSTYTATCTAMPESGDHVLSACGALRPTRAMFDAATSEDSPSDSTRDGGIDD
jgi:hypothetical protein